MEKLKEIMKENKEIMKENKKFKVELNYQKLARLIHGYIVNHYIKPFTDQFDDDKIMEAFIKYRGKKAEIILGYILSNIENALDLTLFLDEYGPVNIPIEIGVVRSVNICADHRRHDPDAENRFYQLQELDCKIRPCYLREASDLISYYKKHFIKLFRKSKNTVTEEVINYCKYITKDANAREEEWRKLVTR